MTRERENTFLVNVNTLFYSTRSRIFRLVVEEKNPFLGAQIKVRE